MRSQEEKKDVVMKVAVAETGIKFGAVVSSVEVAIGLRVEDVVLPQKRVKIIVPIEVGNALQRVLDEYYKTPNALLEVDGKTKLKDFPEVIDKRKKS